MKTMSVMEFKSLCDNLPQETYCFSTSDSEHGNFMISVSFDNIRCFTWPNRVCLYNEESDDYICFDGVECVKELDAHDDCVEQAFEIVCRPANHCVETYENRKSFFISTKKS